MCEWFVCACECMAEWASGAAGVCVGATYLGNGDVADV